MKSFLFTALGLFFSLSVFAKASVLTDSSSIAIEGYDPVSYFEKNKAEKGKDEFQAQHHFTDNGESKSAIYKFSSKEHLDKFKAKPEAYLPQYGGYCAYAVANGTTASIDPEAFAVINGKLYLNYSARVQAKWSKQKEEFIKQADANWPKVLE